MNPTLTLNVLILSNRKRKYLKKPWIDSELLKDIKHKNAQYSITKNDPTFANKEKFRQLRNLVTAKLRNKKKKYFSDYFKKHRSDSEKMWIGFNLALEKSKKRKTFPSDVSDNSGNNISGPKNIANSFAKYFEEIPGKTKKKIPNCKQHFTHFLHKQSPVDNYLTLNNATHDEIYKYVLELKDKSSPGPVNIPNKFLKLIVGPLTPILSHIFNASLNMGYVPECFKIGKQTPVFKSGNVTISNFRPITVCASIGKILEKIVRFRIEKFIDENQILNHDQFGFRRKHSTTHAMINLFENTLYGIENKHKVGGIFLDISKAFDCVNH